MVQSQGGGADTLGEGGGGGAALCYVNTCTGSVALGLHYVQHSSFGMASRNVRAGLATNLTST